MNVFVWPVLLAALGATLGFVLACIAPFAAVATLAARTLPLPYALGAVAAMWAIGQLAGFAFLHYPHATATYGWGVAMGVAAIAATLVARRITSPVFGFAAAFAANEVTLFVYGAASGGRDGFTPAIVAEVLLGNLIGLALLGALRIALTNAAWNVENVSTSTRSRRSSLGTARRALLVRAALVAAALRNRASRNDGEARRALGASDVDAWTKLIER